MDEGMPACERRLALVADLLFFIGVRNRPSVPALRLPGAEIVSVIFGMATCAHAAG
jgi:hypothetical protein